MSNPRKLDQTSSAAAPRKGIGDLRISRPTPANDPTTGAVAEPTATIPAITPPKGGEGGEGAEPASPPSNAAFVANVVRDVADGARAAVCAKPGDPTAGGWPAMAADDVDRQCPPDQNTYLNCSSFQLDGEGSVQARKDRFNAYHFLMLDDVGTKVERD